MVESPTFMEELELLINKHSMENGSNTPDFVLAQYILDCLASFARATQAREDWYGVKLAPSWQADFTDTVLELEAKARGT